MGGSLSSPTHEILRANLTGSKRLRLIETMQASQTAAVAQVRAGDQEAFRTLVEEHSRSVFRLAYRMTGREIDAEEVVQETFLRVYQQFKSFEARSNFRTWLYRIAVNCSIDFLRKRQRHDSHLDSLDAEPEDRVLSLRSPTPLPDRLLFSAQLGERVTQILERMSPVEKAAFVLRHYEELSIEEIAQSLGLRSSATKHAIFRAVQKLRQALEPIVKPRP
jgi:RNA polymerase sigma-70 factor, ECF subfamily